MPSNTTPSASDESHTITAVEAYWMETQLQFSSEADNNVEIVADKAIERIQDTAHSWEFSCSCGEDFPSYEDARIHLLEHGQQSPSSK